MPEDRILNLSAEMRVFIRVVKRCLKFALSLLEKVERGEAV